MIFLSLTSPFDYNVATPYLTNGRYDSVPIGDIFPESCGDPKNQWEYDGHGLHTTMGTISIIHNEVKACAMVKREYMWHCHPSHNGTPYDGYTPIHQISNSPIAWSKDVRLNPLHPPC